MVHDFNCKVSRQYIKGQSDTTLNFPMPSPTPFIIYTNRDDAGWVRYLPDSLDSENSDLVRMTLEDLTRRSEQGNRQLCVISPNLALAVMKPERTDESIKPGVRLQGGGYLSFVDEHNFTHESIALTPVGSQLVGINVQSKKRKHDSDSHTSCWSRQLDYIYELSQSEHTGNKKVKAILDIGPVCESEGRCYGRCYEIVVDWDGNKRARIFEHINELTELF